ncbi:MAG: DUF763 domain-containing protein [Desulfurococcales archaeon]|nr:DUF763 domain-containing protein [Desulfurococcales archaeon]MCE4604985.1 DUF763 domain-containing protein [Desulfurococcales archaeon]
MPGSADLPLHSGKVPPWMLRLMERMGEKIVEAIIEVHGVEGLARGLSDPLWFQAFNNVIGMDWDSSGSTTVVIRVLKNISWRRRDLGFIVLGGKGAMMSRVREEAVEASRILDLDPESIMIASKLGARAASSLLQDGYTLYHHSIVAYPRGFVVIEQGMNTSSRMARRYHIDRVVVEEPFSGIGGVSDGLHLDATSRDSRRARRVFLDIVGEGAPRIVRLLKEANSLAFRGSGLDRFISPIRDEGSHHYRPVRPSKQLVRAIEDLTRYNPSSELELALAPGLGPAVVRALALISDLIYSAPVDHRDPVTHPLDPFIYSYAVGGKDGVPYRYNPDTARRVIEVMEDIVEASRLGSREKLRALDRLRRMVRGAPRGRL